MLKFVILFVLSLTVFQLQFSEALETDSLTSGEYCSECEGENDSDNDHETVHGKWVWKEISLFSYLIPASRLLFFPLPEYKNSYSFSYLSRMLRPPIFSV